MKNSLLYACCLFAFGTAVAKAPVGVVDAIDKLNVSDEEKANIRAAYDDYYNSAETVFRIETKYGIGSIRAKKSTSADLVDPTIRKIQEQARKYHNRFEVLKRTQQKWGPTTNLLARAARQSMQSRLDETRAERDQAKAEAKSLKDMQKAARKFGKNIEKVRKDFEKYRDKASTEDERAFWQSLLDIIPVPNT